MSRPSKNGRPSAKAASKLSLRPFKMPPRTVVQLSNGLTVTLSNRGMLPVVSVRFVTKAGSAFDPHDRLGLSEMTARLLRRGAGGQSAEALNESVDFVGASLSAWSGEDSFGVGLTTPVMHFEPMLEVMSRVLRQPDFPQAEVELAKRRTLAQLSNALDDPDDVADRALISTLFQGHPYGHETIGLKEHIERISRDDLVRYHRDRVTPQGSHLFVVGALDVDTALKAVERAFGDWRGAPAPSVVLPGWSRPKREGDLIIVDKPEQTQVQVRMASKGVPRGHDDHFPLRVMNTVLGGSFTSRLMQAIRVKRGLSYGAGSHFDMLAAAGTFAVSSFTKTETVPELIEVALGEVAKMRAKGPTPAELSSAQRYMAGQYPSQFETNEAIASSMADMALYGLSEDWVDLYRDRVVAVTPKAAAEAAATHLPNELWVTVLVGNASQLEKAVSGFGRVSVVPISELE